jgi:hypothetical protein
VAGRVLVLASAADRGAAGVLAALAGLLPAPRLGFVTAEALDAAAISWRLEGTTVEAALRLADGTELRLEATDTVLDRLPPAEAPAFAAAPQAERGYALSEAMAIRHAWLAAAPARIMNPPAAARTWTEAGPLPWLVRARAAGLPARRAVAASPARAAGHRPGLQTVAIDADRWGSVQPAATETLLPGGWPQLLLEPLEAPFRCLLVCAGEVLGDAPPALGEGVLRLAAEAGTPLLAARFGMATDGTPRFAGASLLPGLLRPEEAGFVAARLAAIAA